MPAVMNPKKQKEVSMLARATEDWEVKVDGLGSEHDTTLDDTIMQAVLTSMCPEEVQNLIYQWVDDKTNCNEIRVKVVALSQNRAAERNPKPTEVGQQFGCGVGAPPGRGTRMVGGRCGGAGRLRW
jgi:hypothetical protein